MAGLEEICMAMAGNVLMVDELSGNTPICDTSAAKPPNKNPESIENSEFKCHHVSLLVVGVPCPASSTNSLAPSGEATNGRPGWRVT